MAKRIVLGLLVLAAVTGVLSAQEASEPVTVSASLDVFPLAKGIIWSDNDADNAMFALAPSFEYLIHPHFTVGGALDMYFGEASNISIFYFGLTVHGRWYPLSPGLDKLFLDAGLGFNAFSPDGETDSKKGSFAGFTMSLKAGYKLMFTPNFFVEPSMAFVYAKTPSVVSVPTPLGWQPGLSIGGAF
jgi:hypothetical protein